MGASFVIRLPDNGIARSSFNYYPLHDPGRKVMNIVDPTSRSTSLAANQSKTFPLQSSSSHYLTVSLNLTPVLWALKSSLRPYISGNYLVTIRNHLIVGIHPAAFKFTHNHLPPHPIVCSSFSSQRTNSPSQGYISSSFEI